MAAPPGPTIVDVAIAVNTEGLYAESFDILIAAVLAADPAVYDTLTGNGQFTVFAPTDSAFEDLFQADEQAILSLLEGAIPQDFQAALTQILLYHVAPGRRYAEDVIASERIRTLYGRGQMGLLDQYNTVLTDNLGRTANIIVTDVEAANGIIHAIDAVVLPFALAP
jgi:uncharacterized surface protein with fasciclin (FAS1) repeats